MKMTRLEILSILATVACLVCLWRSEGRWGISTRWQRQKKRVLIISPTWKHEERKLNSFAPRRPNLYSLLGKEYDEGVTVVLRIWYGPEHLLKEVHEEKAHVPQHLLQTLNQDHRGSTEYDHSRILQKENQDDEVFSVAISFEDIYKTLIFVTAAWVMGAASQWLGMPSLVGEIVTGFLLGPPLADFVPFPEAMVLIGNIGLIGLILESGIDIDVAQLKETGKRAVVMAFTGTSLPLLTGMGIAILAGQDVKSAIAVGSSFAPSSLGVAGNALSAGEVLNTPVGQMIVASSVMDDVLGLIQLSILEVFVKEDPAVIDFILPFLSSFGYLLVLGYSGVTWMPRLLQDKVLARVRPSRREFVAFCIMFALLLAYMPLLNYSKASYLTGAFLAGLTFSQINSVHASFVNNGRQLLNWLLRIFFAASIGFQVPIKKFDNLYVLKWGGIFLVPILSKIPLGAFVPHFQHEVPSDFPYNPYWRDVFITSLAMTCRGEFNFIIAAFALGQGLFDAYLYSAVVFAVLLSSIVSPMLLLKLARYYNDKSKEFLEAGHDIHRIGNTCDGYRPLYLAIQARTPIHWGLQEKFEKALADNGLIMIDHRSWHTLGLESVDITEMFVQDTKIKVRIPSCFGDPETGTMIKKDGGTMLNTDTQESAEEQETSSDSSASEPIEGRIIEERCNELRHVLEQCLEADDPQDYSIQVSRWTPFVFDTVDSTGNGRVRYRLQTQDYENAGDNDDTGEVVIDHDVSSDIGEDDITGGRTRSNTVESTFGDATSSQMSAGSTIASPGSGHRKRVGTIDSAASVGSRRGSVKRANHRRTGTLTSANDDHALHHELQLGSGDLWEMDFVAQDVALRGYVMVPVEHGYDVIEGEDLDGLETAPTNRHRRRNTYDASQLAAHVQSSLAPDILKERLHGYVRD